jgi:competence ComEA-like helix-hairpin-helix protein
VSDNPTSLVNINTASAPLLRYVAGLNQLRAHAIVDWRQEKGPFKSREQLRDVPGQSFATEQKVLRPRCFAKMALNTKCECASKRNIEIYVSN